MKNFLSFCLLFVFLLTLTGCYQCCRYEPMECNPITPKDCYYQDYYESAPFL